MRKCQLVYIFFIQFIFQACVRNPQDNPDSGSLSQGGLRTYVELGFGFTGAEYNKWTGFSVTHNGISKMPEFDRSVQIKTLSYVNGVARVLYTHPEADTVFRIYYDNSPYINHDLVKLSKRQEFFRFRSTDGYTTPYGVIPLTKLQPNIPADAFKVKASGLPYNGWVTLNGTDGSNGFTNSELACINGINIAIDSTGQKKLLFPVAFGNWNFRGENGEELQLKDGAAIRLMVGNSFVSNTSRMRVYYLDKNSGLYNPGDLIHLNGTQYELFVRQTDNFIAAYESELAEIKGRITGNYNKPMPGIWGEYIAGNSIGVSMAYGNNLRVDENGYYHFFVPANSPLEERIYSPFTVLNTLGGLEYEKVATTQFPAFSPGVHRIPDRSFDRNYYFMRFDGDVVDSFLNPVADGSVMIRVNNLGNWADINHDLAMGPVAPLRVSNGKYSGSVLVSDTALPTMEFRYDKSDLTIPGTFSSLVSSYQYQFFDLINPVTRIAANPVVFYDFNRIRKKAVIYKGNQRQVSDYIRHQGYLNDTAFILVECYGLNGAWPYVAFKYIRTPNVPAQVDKRIVSISFYADTISSVPNETWLPVGDSRIILNYANPEIMNIPDETYNGALKGTFRSPSGTTADWKLIFNTD